jgi:hypothetical protein
MSRGMPARPSQSGVKPARKPAATPDQHLRLPAVVQRQIEHIYVQLDAQLTRLAEIQLQFDDLRSKIRHL